jgi:hypothetical protein
VFVVLLAVRLVVVRFGTDDVDVARTVVLGFRDITALQLLERLNLNVVNVTIE